MKLNKRITAICGAVERGESIADIGTDHGYVPLFLYRSGISPVTIMCDISGASLAKAEDAFASAGISVPDDWFRQGNGLEPVERGEVDDIIIAGLGGRNIIGVLSEDIHKTEDFGKLILQPRKNSGELRHFLYTSGFDIICEALAAEGRFVCEVITAVPSGEGRRDEPCPASDISWQYPETLKSCDPVLLEKLIGRKLLSIEREVENLGFSRRDEFERTASLSSDVAYLKGLLG